MIKKIIFTVALVVFSVGVVLGQNQQLKELLSEGLENNYSLKIVKKEQAQAENNASFTNSGMLPTLSVVADWDFYNEHYDITYREDNSNLKYTNNDHTLSTGIDLNWTIFDGFKIQTSYKKYKELEDRSKISTRIAVEDFVAVFVAEYFNNIKENQRLKNLERAMKLSGERFRIVDARYKIGTFSRLDFLQARVDFNVDRAAFIKQREVVYTSSINLAKLLSADSLSHEINIIDSVITVNRSLNDTLLLKQMFENNSEILYAKKDVAIADLDYKTVIARNYPYLTMYAGYGYAYNKYSRASTLKNNYHGYDAGVSFGITIFDPTRRTAKRNAKLSQDMAKLGIQELELELRAQLKTFWQAYKNNMQLLKLESVSRTVAKENYEIANERYMLGDLSGIEMREAENSLLDAENRILDAIYNTKICEISLMQISGNLNYYL